MQKLSIFIEKLKVYIPIILFILGWWVFAFKEVTPAGSQRLQCSKSSHPDEGKLNDLIPRTSRKSIQQALAGDISLMTALITAWDIDAQVLCSKGLAVKRLSSDLFLKSHKLGRFLKTSRQREEPRPNRSFLPQTYMAASFLLALTTPAEIVALPASLRDQTQMYPLELTSQIPLDIDRENSEKIYLKNPEIAFVAHYSHPTTVEALQNQGIAIHTMNDPLSIDDISLELVSVGSLIDRKAEAELMAIFIEGAMLHLDNTLAELTARYHENHISLPKILFLYYYKHFLVPTKKNLTGQLLHRLGDFDASLPFAAKTGNEAGWTVPIDKENLFQIDPDFLIIADKVGQASEMGLHKIHEFQQLRALQPQVYFVDEAVQQSPSQYLVLAYFDIVDILVDICDHDDRLVDN